MSGKGGSPPPVRPYVLSFATYHNCAAHSSGAVISWGSTPITAEGGQYRLCWCADRTRNITRPINGTNNPNITFELEEKDLHACRETEHFRVDFGGLYLVGPTPLYQDRTCVSGQSCELQAILGHSLTSSLRRLQGTTLVDYPGDRFLILDTCGAPLVLPRFPPTERIWVGRECGCAQAEIDSDGDGVLDCYDGCPHDFNKTMPGICGCGEEDTDTDNDGTSDCQDFCPMDPTKTVQGDCSQYSWLDLSSFTVNQSSTWTGGTFKATPERATDGNKNSDFHGRSCTHTRTQEAPWWKVKLDGDYLIANIRVTMRDTIHEPECRDPKDYRKVACQNEPDQLMKGFLIWVTDAAATEPWHGDRCTTEPWHGENGTIPITGYTTDVECSNHTIGSQIWLQLPGKGRTLVLCEFEVKAKFVEDTYVPGSKCITQNRGTACGCGVPDIDSDGDGSLDCFDNCPADPNKIYPGICGCGVSDVDSDGDGIADCNDDCSGAGMARLDIIAGTQVSCN